MHAKLLQLCLTLCDPVDCSPSDSSVHVDSLDKNIGLPFLPPGDLSNLEVKTTSPALGGRFLTAESPGKHMLKLLKFIF